MSHDVLPTQKYKPRTYEEQLRPYEEKYTLERLKPKPIKPIIGETWKDTVEGRWEIFGC